MRKVYHVRKFFYKKKLFNSQKNISSEKIFACKKTIIPDSIVILKQLSSWRKLFYTKIISNNKIIAPWQTFFSESII